MIAALKGKACRLADLHRKFRRDHAVGATPDPVRPEIFAWHLFSLNLAAGLARRIHAKSLEKILYGRKGAPIMLNRLRSRKPAA
ncbi:MAG: hypothetical protein NVSMB26_16830 [Beijerinckiaceae bacterium]